MSTVHDWRTLDLGPGGRSLIEASAGTGKTWTIAVLYLRLLLEHSLTPAQIVVATFTDAAAQELRQRIRGRLLQANAQIGAALASPPTLPSPAASDDAWSAWLQSRLQGEHGGFDAVRAGQLSIRLRLALAELDIAPIGTLHSLSQRILREAPFDSGSGFAVDELVAGADLANELADDAWRRLVQGDAPPDADAQAWIAAGRSKLKTALRAALQPGVQVAVAQSPALDAWLQPAMAADFRAYADNTAWYASSRSVLPRGLRALADWIDAGDPSSLPPAKALEDALKPLASQIHKTRLAEAQSDPVFASAHAAAQCLQAEPDARRARGLARITERARRERDERQCQRQQLSFDGLIERVHAALHAQPALADALHARWPVALVDEFQDTDALQYGVLDRIHRDAGGAPRGRLVMIGDPKQAIYRFRGGDIHAYLDAAAQVAAADRIALDVNWRSSRAYVGACNAWYALGGETLSSNPAHAIHYRPIAPSGRCDDAPYRIDHAPVARPLVVHYLAECADSAGARRAAALQACAEHVVALLSGAHAIGDEPLRPGDIAVLLPYNRDIEVLRGLLQQRGVPCVGAGRSSVFASLWAHELHLQLQAAAQPRDAGLLRAALATRLGGVDFPGLRALAQADSDAWQRHQQRYQALHRDWLQRGVLAVVQAVLAEAAPRLFAGRDGERALTDLRQLGELLQAQESEHPGHAQLLAWLARQMGEDAEDGEEAGKDRQLRIESDARRVQLLTVHAAKGLEFPIVLLPLMWAHDGGREAKADFVVVHDAAGGGRALHFDAQAQARSEQGAQDERFRLLYVALTRAEHACHVYALDPQRPKDGGSKTARKDPERAPLDAMLERLLAATDAGRTLEALAPHLGWQPGWPRHAGRLPLDAADTRPRAVLPMPPAPPVHERRHSFSTLVRHAPAGLQEEHPASDEASADEAAEFAVEHEPVREHATERIAHPQLEALARWKGTEFGNALHAALELRRFDAPLQGQTALVAQALREYGVRLPASPAEQRVLVDTVAARLDAVLAAELLPGLRLGDIGAEHWRAEMAFDYQLGEVQLAALRAACLAHGEPDLMPITMARTLRGVMTGKIDLVFMHAQRFHVLDWKSNWLGECVEDYAPGALDAAMDAHQYRLQALLYTVALERYLRQRISGYERGLHLGEPVYLFLRAVGLAPGAGVWARRFDDGLIDAVDAVLAGVEVAA